MEDQVTKKRYKRYKRRRRSYKDKIKAHIASGKSVNATDKEGYNFLHDTVSKNDYESTKFLVEECNADINCGTTKDTTKKCREHLTNIDDFLDRIFYIQSQPQVPGNTPLHLATFYYGSKTMRYLVDKGANINAQNEEGKTPLHLNLEDEFLEEAKFLIERGASVHITDKNGITPLDHMDKLSGGTFKALLSRTGGIY